LKLVFWFSDSFKKCDLDPCSIRSEASLRDTRDPRGAGPAGNAARHGSGSGGRSGDERGIGTDVS
jgi:hypothetical protein